MNTDTQGRRLRFAPPSPRDARILLQEADQACFEAIDRHGPLPSNYLYEFSKHRRGGELRLKHRLTELYHGDADGPFLTRPQAQFAGFHARYQHAVYDLSKRARKALRAPVAFPPTGSTWFLHQLMQACAGASFELLAPEGLRYVSRSEVFTHPAVKQRSIPLPNGKAFSPDDVFALKRDDGVDRFFVVEIDRATESMSPHAHEKERTTYFTKKLEHYSLAYSSQLFRLNWGFARPKLLILTTNANRARLILSEVQKYGLGDHTYVAIEETFGSNWRVPKGLLTQLYEPWQTVNGPKRITD